MFEQNFNFNTNKETISEEIRKLVSDTRVCPSIKEDYYLELWKNKILDLSKNN